MQLYAIIYVCYLSLINLIMPRYLRQQGSQSFLAAHRLPSQLLSNKEKPGTSTALRNTAVYFADIEERQDVQDLAPSQLRQHQSRKRH